MAESQSDLSENEEEFPLQCTRFPKELECITGLKPKMDAIFAEVEKSIPTIDFDLSDVSTFYCN